MVGVCFEVRGQRDQRRLGKRPAKQLEPDRQPGMSGWPRRGGWRESTRLRLGATDREVGVVAAVLVAGSEKAAAHRLGLSHSTVKHHLANARSDE